MLHSYRWRLFVGLLLVSALSILLVALLASEGVSRRFVDYVSLAETEEREAIASVIDLQLQSAGPEDIGPLLEGVGAAFERPISLEDASGRVLSSTSVEAIEEQIIVGESGAVTTSGTRTITLTVGADGRLIRETRDSLGLTTETLVSAESSFLNQTYAGLLIAAVAAVGLAGLASWWLSRSLMRPVAALTGAAEGLAAGDLSRRVAVERPDELGRLAISFNAMAASLETQETLRRQMVGDIAHELRTPLGNVRGYLEAVQDGVVTADDALVASLHEETLLLGRLINDLQDLSLAEAGQLRLDIRAQDAAAVLEAAARSSSPAAREKGVAIEVSVPPELPPVAADAERLGQVLRNLLANAIHHTPPGGAVALLAAATDGGVTMRVTDSGPGIPPEHLPYIFERFYRADPSRERSTGGSGLGLAIAQALVKQQGGRIGAESPPGEGASFWVWLPSMAH